ncbi:MAG TPA: DUF6259 domain-containing protein [Thermoguttaceae bacterium]|nr:DUF6259 domain-containing protein [Thermoguttaceae bacterium]
MPARPTPVVAKGILLLCLASVARGQVEVRDEPGRLILRNGQSTIVIDKQAHGAIASLIDASTGRELVERDPASCLFRLGLSKPGDASGELIWLTSRSAETVAYAVAEDGPRKTATLTFERLGGRQLQARCTVSVGSDDESILWRFGLEGSEPLILEEVQYPVVVLRATEREDEGNDAFVAGHVKGGVFAGPSQWRAGTALDFSQPGPLAAQFGCYYDPACGFYSATRDGRGYPKRLHFQRTKSGLEFVWKQYCHHATSTPFDLGYAVAQATFRSRDPATPTDWRDAADLYKAWALGQPWCQRTLAERDDLPGWLKQGPAMVRFRRRHDYMPVRLENHRDWYSQPEQIEGWLRGYWQEHFPDVPLIVAFWGWEHVASWVAPEYFPPYPSEEGLRRRVKAVRDVGGHPFFWPSGYQWALTFGERPDGTFQWDNREAFEKLAAPHARVTRDGSLLTRRDWWLRGGANCMLCRGDAWSRGRLDETAVELVRRGASAIQIDQVVFGCGPQERGVCYRGEHGHPPGPGPWFTEAFAEQLRTMGEACRRLHPDTILGFEGAQEFHLQQIGVQDYRDFEIYWKPYVPGQTPASVFAYLYHEFVPLFQSNPEGFRGKPTGGNQLMMAYCLVNGQMPHLVPHWPLGPTPALRNGGFERREGNAPEGWSCDGGPDDRTSGVLHCDEKTKHGGKLSLRLESPLPDGVVRLEQSIGIGRHELEVGDHGLEVGGTYRLRLWFKAEKLRDPSAVRVEAIDAERVPTATWQIPLARCDDWRQGEASLTIPPAAVRLQITVEIAGPCKAWIDDVVLEALGDDDAYRVAKRDPILPAEHDLALQWVRLFHGRGRPYLLMGRMLHPPRLVAEKTKYLLPPATQAIQARVPLHLSDGDGKIIETAAIDVAGDVDWVRKEVTFTVPRAAERARLYLHFQVKGKFWFDDVVLTEIGSEENLLRNGDFEQWEDPSATAAAWTAARRWGEIECMGKLSRDEVEKHGGRFAVRLANQTGDVVQLSQGLPVDGKTLCQGKTYRLSLWMKTQGVGRSEWELPAILHNAFRAPDGSEAVIAVNVTDKPQTGTLTWGGRQIDLHLEPWKARLVEAPR